MYFPFLLYFRYSVQLLLTMIIIQYHTSQIASLSSGVSFIRRLASSLFLLLLFFLSQFSFPCSSHPIPLICMFVPLRALFLLVSSPLSLLASLHHLFSLTSSLYCARSSMVYFGNPVRWSGQTLSFRVVVSVAFACLSGLRFCTK